MAFTSGYKHVIVSFLRVNPISHAHDLAKEHPSGSKGPQVEKGGVQLTHAEEIERMCLTVPLVRQCIFLSSFPPHSV